MDNTFYKRFDSRPISLSRRQDYRTPFQQDRDRIIHSFAFRRLQAKTQVFWSGEYDFYRTRLTHSIEVAQIGRSICNYLKNKCDLLNESFYIDQDLVEAVCLAHDLGHPPFGHASERYLNQLMQRYGGFEGNAQTLRMITDIFYSSDGGRRGMAPTRALIDGIMKYKTLYSQLERPEKHFIYDYQKKCLDFIFEKAIIPNKISLGDELNNFRSIECQIMDWADDISFSISDFSDGIRAGFISVEKVKNWLDDNKKKGTLDKEEEKIVDNMLEIMSCGEAEIRFSRKIGKFVEACSLEKRKSFMSKHTNRYKFGLVIKPLIMKEKDLYKRISNDLVFKSTQISQLEHKSKYMLGQLFKTLEKSYIKKFDDTQSLLPKDVQNYISTLQGKNERARAICDYISGMTDRFAVRTYRRLFDPDFGSIVDFV